MFSALDKLRITSLNINGGREGSRTAILAEFVKHKNVDVLLLQETHSDRDNEVEWGMWWDGKYALSHGSNLSAGVAVFLSGRLGIARLHVNEFRGFWRGTGQCL